MRRLPDRFTIVVGVLILAITGYLGWIFRSYMGEDAAITLRVSRNFAEGHGLVFNIGEHYQSTSAPGYALFLGLLGKIFGSAQIPFLTTLVSAFAQAMLGFGLYALGKQSNQRVLGAVAALLTISAPFLWQCYGNEVIPEVALIVWGAVRANANRVLRCSLLLAVATLIRPDAVLAVITILAGYLLKYRRVPVRASVLYFIIVLPFAYWSFSYYGFLLPQTMALKKARIDFLIQQKPPVDFTYWTKGIGALKQMFSIEDPAAYLRALAALGLFFVLAKRWRFLVPILSWSILYGLFYTFYYRAYAFWYLAPIWIGCAILCAAIFAQCWHWARDLSGESGKLLFVLAAVLTWLGALWFSWDGITSAFSNIPTTLVFLIAYVPAFLAIFYIGRKVAKVAPPVIERMSGKPFVLVSFLPFGACVFAFLAMLYTFLRMAPNWERSWESSSHRRLYLATGEWLEKHVSPTVNNESVKVAYIEIGLIGWQAKDLSILDSLGLGSAGMLPYVSHGDEYAEAIRALQPQIVLGHPLLTPGTVMTGTYPYFEWRQDFIAKHPGWNQWFNETYHPVKHFDYREKESITVFARNDLNIP